MTFGRSDKMTLIKPYRLKYNFSNKIVTQENRAGKKNQGKKNPTECH